MEPKTIAYFLILIFFSIVFIQSGIDKVVDKKGNMSFLLSLTDFGHLGIFPEHAFLWDFMRSKLIKPGLKVLNLFAYTGGATVALLQKKAFVCHVDASKPVLEWAKKNVKQNDLDQKLKYI